MKRGLQARLWCDRSLCLRLTAGLVIEVAEYGIKHRHILKAACGLGGRGGHTTTTHFHICLLLLLLRTWRMYRGTHSSQGLGTLCASRFLCVWEMLWTCLKMYSCHMEREAPICWSSGQHGGMPGIPRLSSRRFERSGISCFCLGLILVAPCVCDTPRTTPPPPKPCRWRLF